MSLYAVWIDQELAKVFAIDPSPAGTKTDPVTVHSHRIDHHTHALDHLDRDRRTHRMFEEAAKLLGDTQGVLIVGPGLAKYLFNNFLAEHFPRVFRKVTGVEPLDHPSDPQIRALGERFFRARAMSS
jgi:hypothetical protein